MIAKQCSYFLIALAGTASLVTVMLDFSLVSASDSKQSLDKKRQYRVLPNYDGIRLEVPKNPSAVPTLSENEFNTQYLGDISERAQTLGVSGRCTLINAKGVMPCKKMKLGFLSADKKDEVQFTTSQQGNFTVLLPSNDEFLLKILSKNFAITNEIRVKRGMKNINIQIKTSQ